MAGTLTEAVAALDPGSRALLELSLRGSYDVWLFDSVVESARIGPLRDGALRASLPANADEFRFIDVARRSPTGDHGGESVVRVRVEELLPAA
jgi:hypothetical protein